MKYILISTLVFTLCSCSEQDHQSLEPLKIEHIDDISYLMIEMEIDSVVEIITYGQYSSAKENDTLNLYVLKGNKTVNQNLNSFMCCTYTYEYDSLGILAKSSTFSDYDTKYQYKYSREGERIEINKIGSYNNSKTHEIIIENELLISQSSRDNIDKDYSNVVKYVYNSNNQLIKRHSEARNHPGGEFDYMVILKTYEWNDTVLSKTKSKQFYNDGKDFYETTTLFDASGFPETRVMTNNKDTIYTSVIKRVKRKKT